jgi:membrane-associated phospholipid phosphatase
MLAFSSRVYGMQLFYFILALLVGYSRIYLGHHFFKDVYVGSIIGFITSLIVVWSLRNKLNFIRQD